MKLRKVKERKRLYDSPDGPAWCEFLACGHWLTTTDQVRDRRVCRSCRPSALEAERADAGC